ncbi:MAG: AAA family ATPase [Caldilineaceae bacterium]
MKERARAEPLRINLLGTPEIRRGASPVTFATRKALALLLYLACNPGAQQRETLADLFWGNAPREQGRASLRRALAYLRKALAEEALLQSDDHMLAFNPAYSPQLDLTTLQETLLATATWPAAQAESSNYGAALQAAAALIRGEFLADFSLPDAPDFDAWLYTERHLWQQRAATLLQRLAQWHYAHGDWRATLATTQQWLRLEPLAEEGWRRQIQAHLARGDLHAAQASFEQCRALLARELDASPEPETLALAAQIAARRSQRSSHPATTAQLADLRHRLQAPLLGRGTEWATLITALETCRAHHPAICLIEGEAGIGKSRLAEAILTWAGEQGFDLMQGRAFEMGGRVAYQPLVEALQNRLSHENAPDDLLSDLWLSELSRLIPDLRDRYPDLPPPLPGNEAEAQSRLFEATARLVEALAKRRPLLWWIDDLQWADQASLDLLRFLAHRWGQSQPPILLLLTMRNDASLHNDSTLRDWLAGAARDLPLHAVQLGPLNANDIYEWVSILAGESSASESAAEANQPLLLLSQRLHSETGGQPLFLSEMLKGLAEQGLIQVAATATGSTLVDFGPLLARLDQLAGFMPTGIRELIGARLARLSPAARTLLRAGAILGQQLHFEAVTAIAELAETEAIQAWEELLAANLLIAVTGDAQPLDPPYLFSHDRIRGVVYEQIDSARRRIFHRKAFAALQTRNAPAAELAHHALAAGAMQPAFRYCLQAGHEALAAFALSQALAHYRQAQALQKEPTVAASITQAESLSLALQLGRALELQNDWEAARTVYGDLRAHAQQAGWPTVECTALNRLANLYSWQAQSYQQAMSLLMAARELAAQHHDQAGMVETLCNLAQLHMYLDQPEALEFGEEAVQLARQLDAPLLLAQSLNALGHAYQNRGRWEAIIPLAHEARQLYAQLGDRVMEAEQYTMLAMEYCNMGEAAQSLAAGYRALALTEALENQWGQAFAAFALAMMLSETEQVQEGLRLAQRSVDLVAPLGIPPVHIIAVAALGVNQLADGQWSQAAATLAAAAEMNRTNGDMAGNREMLASYQCLAALCLQQWTPAADFARQAGQARGAERSLSAALPRWAEVAALLHVGEQAAAAAELQRLAHWAASSPRLQLCHLRAQIEFLRHEGNHVDAEELRRQAAALAAELGLPHESAQLAIKPSPIGVWGIKS